MQEHDHSTSAGHSHHHGHHHHGDDGSFHDYLDAVKEYRKTFSSKQDVIEQTPDPAVRDMLLTMEKHGIQTTFDRFDQQKPHCTYGLAGICCKNCTMGPCQITRKSPRGACGADADVIVSRNLLRAVAAGAAAHGARGRESMLALKATAEGRAPFTIAGRDKVISTARAYGLDTEGVSVEHLASQVADILLEDLSRTIPSPHRTIAALAPEERKQVWEALDILPISTYHEVFESLHRTTTGTDGDWRNIMRQYLRVGAAYAWSSVLGSSIAMDSLFGLPHRATSKVNMGALRTDTVNIAVHGHSPVLVSEIVRVGSSPEYQQKARDVGASGGIQFYGICCSGLSAMYRYNNVIPLSNAIGAELILGTGALDLWVADVQDVFPSIMEVAHCFKTTVVTTSDSARLPGAEHIAFTHNHSNLSEATEIATKIVERALESHSERSDIEVHIPSYEIETEVGFSVEYLVQHYSGSLAPLARAIENGTVLGVVNLVGCNNPRIVYEKAVADVAQRLIENNVIVLTNGCASYPLMKLGYCSTKALAYVGDELRGFLGDMPPVWHMGECLDNARASTLFKTLSAELDIPMKELPFAFASPEWSNEKGMCASLAFRLLGLNSYHCVETPMQGSDAVSTFMTTGTKELLGSEMYVDTDPRALADKILDDFHERRRARGWKE